MKMTTMILMVAGGLAMQAVAAEPNDKGPSAFKKSQKETWTSAYQIWQPKKSTTSYKIERVGGISSRPWAQTAGQPAPALFYDQRVYETHFNLFWIGATPE